METYITICKIDSQWEFAVCLRKFKQGHCINLEGWDGVRDWREVQTGEDICIPMADSCWGLKWSELLVSQSCQTLCHPMDCRPPTLAHCTLDLNSTVPQSHRGLELKYYKQRQNILVFLRVALSRTPRELCVGFLLGEVVVRISRYINKMGHSRAISAHCDIPSK